MEEITRPSLMQAHKQSSKKKKIKKKEEIYTNPIQHIVHMPSWMRIVFDPKENQPPKKSTPTKVESTQN